LIEQPTDSMDAITHILSVAARYGSKVQMSSKGTDNVLELHLNHPSASGEETVAERNIVDISARHKQNDGSNMTETS